MVRVVVWVLVMVGLKLGVEKIKEAIGAMPMQCNDCSE